MGETPRLVLVSTPAGFGKTTLLSQWLADATDEGHVAWLSLDAADNDLRRFLEHVVAALQTVGELSEAAELLATAAKVPPEAVLTAVVNDLDLQPGRTLLALDDYHVIDAPEVHKAVTLLLDHLPPKAGLAVATRADPPLPLPRLRARRELVELRASDLRFTPDEAAAFLADVMGLDLSQTQVAALEARTEGWVAGLQLAGLSLRGVDDAAEFVDAFTGSHRFILDYLVEEVLRHQPEPVRRFLLDTAVRHQLTGSLCDAVTDGHDRSATLESHDRANLFIVPLDDQRQWYRYHHLFADALRARLSAEQPDRASALHGAASEWYAAHGLPEDAVRHALAADVPGHAADLVEGALPDLRRERRDRVLREWLNSMSREPEASAPGGGGHGVREGTGGDLYYEERGHGIPILLIHPAGATASTWGSVLEELAQVGRVVAYDRRGYSRSPGEPVHSIPRHTGDAAAILKTLRRPSAVVVGTSVGATIGIDLALRRPDMVRAVIAYESPGAHPGAAPPCRPSRPWPAPGGWHCEAAMPRQGEREGDPG